MQAQLIGKCLHACRGNKKDQTADRDVNGCECGTGHGKLGSNCHATLSCLQSKLQLCVCCLPVSCRRSVLMAFVYVLQLHDQLQLPAAHAVTAGSVVTLSWHEVRS